MHRNLVVGIRQAGRRVPDRRGDARQITGAERVGRHQVRQRRFVRLADALEGAEEERPVPDDRPAARQRRSCWSGCLGLIALPAASLGANRLTLLSALSLMNQNPVPRNWLVPLLLVVVTSVTCMNSALLFALLTLNSSIDSTDGNISRAGPPPRLLWLAMPSIENEVMKGRLPATEMAPPRSCWTPGASVATTIGLVELVARKFKRQLVDVVARSRVVDRGAARSR